MTKQELLNQIKQVLSPDELVELSITSRTSKEELQAIYDGLHVHKKKETPEETPEEKPEEKPEETPEEKPEETPEEKPEETPEEKPEETPEEKPDDGAFKELLGKIEGAEIPHSQPSKDKPLFERKSKRQSKKQSEPEATRIEGYVLLIVVDTVYPFTLAWLNNLLDKKGKKIEPHELQLAEKDFSKLEPLADQAADYLAININPVAGFFLIASFMYANNLLIVKMNK